MQRMDNLREQALQKFNEAQKLEKEHRTQLAVNSYEQAIDLLQQIPQESRTTHDLRELDAYHWEAACAYGKLGQQEAKSYHITAALNYLMTIKASPAYQPNDEDIYYEVVYKYESASYYRKIDGELESLVLPMSDFEDIINILDQNGFTGFNEDELRKLYAESVVKLAELRSGAGIETNMVSAYQKALTVLSDTFNSQRKLIKQHTEELQKLTAHQQIQQQKYRIMRQQAELLVKNTKRLDDTTLARLHKAEDMLRKIPDEYMDRKGEDCLLNIRLRLAEFNTALNQGQKREREEAKPSATIGTTFNSKPAEPKKAKQEAAHEQVRQYDTVHMTLRSGKRL